MPGPKAPWPPPRSRRIGITTPSTIASHAYESALARLGGPDVHRGQGLPAVRPPGGRGLGSDHPASRLVAVEYLALLAAAPISTPSSSAAPTPLGPAWPRSSAPASAQDFGHGRGPLAPPPSRCPGPGEDCCCPGPQLPRHRPAAPALAAVGERFLGRPMTDVWLETLV